ncbi:type II toxin-antitoxin system RelE/ParE family toxin [Methylobacterium isbiliense]|uniref:type II toxin-antitoxin system RelE/ParE family toxin n=1 Tax=Methylobacterium isbiliense TaxID=315478 RepID=UPI00357102EE
MGDPADRHGERRAKGADHPSSPDRIRRRGCLRDDHRPRPRPGSIRRSARHPACGDAGPIRSHAPRPLRCGHPSRAPSDRACTLRSRAAAARCNGHGRFGGLARFRHVFKAARRKLGVIDAATPLDEVKRPPGNTLRAPTNDRAGHHAIRVDDRVRICFAWTDHGPARVEIVDHH